MDADLAAKMDTQLVLGTSASMTATFQPFPRLPTELRIKIWELFIPETRGRLIWMRQPGWIMADKERFTSILLSACPESREVYLKRFPMGLELNKREVSFSDYWGHQWRSSVDWWGNIGTIYINPEQDVLVLGQPGKEFGGNPFHNRRDFTLLAKPLRREGPRQRIRNIIEFPGSEELRDEFDIEFSESEAYDPEDTYENKLWGFPTKHWTFDGVTKRLMLTHPFDKEETLKFCYDAKNLSDREVLQKWGGRYTLT